MMDSYSTALNDYMTECNRAYNKLAASGTPHDVPVAVTVIVPRPELLRGAFCAYFREELFKYRWKCGRHFKVRYCNWDGLLAVTMLFDYEADDDFMERSMERYDECGFGLDKCDLYDEFEEEYPTDTYHLMPHEGRMYPMYIITDTL